MAGMKLSKGPYVLKFSDFIRYLALVIRCLRPLSGKQEVPCPGCQQCLVLIFIRSNGHIPLL